MEFPNKIDDQDILKLEGGVQDDGKENADE